MTTITLKALLEVLLGMQGTFVLCNAHGSLEFKGQDLYLSPYQEWLTVYHATPKSRIAEPFASKWHTFQRAVVTHGREDTLSRILWHCRGRRRSTASLVFPQLLQLGQWQN